MERMTIEAFPRQRGSKGSRKQLRARGMIPAVVYGLGREALPVSLNSISLKKALNTPAGLNVILDLEIKGEENGSSKETVMVKELQRHPLQRDFFLSADLIRISLTEKIEVAVPLNFTGEAKGVKEGGIFQIQYREVNIRCLPGDIPQHLDVPIDDLGIGDVLTFGELYLPEGVEMMEDPSESVASVLAPQEEKAEAEEEAEARVDAAEKPAEEKTAEDVE